MAALLSLILAVAPAQSGAGGKSRHFENWVSILTVSAPRKPNFLRPGSPTFLISGTSIVSPGGITPVTPTVITVTVLSKEGEIVADGIITESKAGNGTFAVNVPQVPGGWPEPGVTFVVTNGNSEPVEIDVPVVPPGTDPPKPKAAAKPSAEPPAAALTPSSTRNKLPAAQKAPNSAPRNVESSSRRRRDFGGSPVKAAAGSK